MKKRKTPKGMFSTMPATAAYSTAHGVMLQGVAEKLLKTRAVASLKKRVQLIFTSPPFPLNRKKKYGNLQGEAYADWLTAFGPLFKEFLTDDGSIVIELGNSWEPSQPTMSTLALKSLLRFQEENDLHLCQEIICHNPARLPSPAQWVTIERIRLKDSYTRLWWMSPNSRPKANNRRVLQEYSQSMQGLLKSGKYNAGARPSEHHISEGSFTKDNGGSIPPSVLSYANTQANDNYLGYCRSNEITSHPARMPIALPEFFIKLLSEPGDIVLDPFGGSNTTGAAAERQHRYWVSIEPQQEYISGSVGRFKPEDVCVYAPSASNLG